MPTAPRGHVHHGRAPANGRRPYQLARPMQCPRRAFAGRDAHKPHFAAKARLSQLHNPCTLSPRVPT